MVNYESEVERIGSFLKKVIGKKNAVIGVSGGIDSALVLSILSRYIRKDAIYAYFMPDSVTPESDFTDVKALSVALGIPVRTINIDAIVATFSNVLDVKDKRALGNIKSRTRMTALYYEANVNNALVVGTTNRSEYLLGYYTKYGDGGCDVEPIIHLYKTDIYAISKIMGIPESIIDKRPSAGLWASQTDEDELGITYSEADPILRKIFDEGFVSDDEKYMKLMDLHMQSEHKRSMPYRLDED
ncbi:MAG: NAD+ synthase [Thermoplasmata archaeon]